jgi:hypothetical protein
VLQKGPLGVCGQERTSKSLDLPFRGLHRSQAGPARLRNE